MKTKIGFVNLLMASVLAWTAILGGVLPKQVVQAYTTDSLIFINEIHYDNDGTDADEAVEIAGPAGTDLSGWSLVPYNGNGGGQYSTTPLSGTIPDQQNGYGTLNFPILGLQNGAPDGIALLKPDDSVVLFLSYEGSFAATDGPAVGLTSTDIGVSEPGDTPLGQSLQLSGIGDSYFDFTWQSPAASSPGDINNNQIFGNLIFINEIHYDNDGTDADEAVEIAGPAGTDLSGWLLVPYNGNGGVQYSSTSLSGTIPDQQNGYGTLNFPISGLQNGAPDGIALVKPDNSVVLFLSYEGSFTATDGPAAGLTSIDIGVSEPGDTPVGYSLQLSGYGFVYEQFIWNSPASSTPGEVNSNQFFSNILPLEPKINEFVANHVGTDTNEYIEIYGEPDTDYTLLTILEIEGDDTGQGVIDEVIQVGTTNSEGFWVTNFLSNAIENGTLTLLLVKNFSGTLGNDLDTYNDGIFDVTPWDEIIDSVAVSDGGSLDKTYGLPVLTSDFDGQSFTVGGASRIPDGYDTDATSDWVRNDFDLAGIDGFTGSIGLGEAYNTPGSTNLIFIPPPEACGDAYTPIFTIQGNGLASPLDGTEVATEGVVVGDFQVGGKNGFYLQDPVGDGDTTTSDGIFVYGSGLDVNVGDHIRVRGYVDEYFELTEITNVSQAWYCGAGDPVSPTSLSLPVNDVNDFEAYENMLVTFPQDLIISEYFNFDRYGEIVLTSHRHLTPTALFEPGSPEQAAMAEFYLLDRITLDDGRTNQNPDPAIHPNGDVFDMDNLFRGGDLVTNVTGVLDYNYSLWKIQPTQGADYTSTNLRTNEPEEVGGSIKVASFNVLNYFSTIDTGDDICGPSQDMECRGADTEDEFTRQRDKIFAALSIIDADIVGLMEIENHITDAAVMDFVDGLNAVVGAGTYAYIDTGFIGTDAIKVAIIYKTATVTPLGDYAILDSTVDPRFDDSKNRPTLAQTFQEIASGETVTVAVNHLKSKGSDCEDVDDPDLGDGAGNCNLTRTAAAEAMVDWLAADPTGTGSINTLIIGDLNSYDKEDPIDAILAGADDLSGTSDDYLDLIYTHVGEAAYSYVFDGQVGYLDHALANKFLFSQITGTTIWHINADEPDLIDYDMSFKADAQDALYAPDQYRSSDHDPVIIGLNLKTYQFFLPIINK